MAVLRFHAGNSTRENERVGQVASSLTRLCSPMLHFDGITVKRLWERICGMSDDAPEILQRE